MFLLFLLPCLIVPILAADRCSVIPPSLWCSNSDLISQCGFKEHCDRYSTATRNKPIQLTVLIEALCPDCQNWIIQELYPKIYKNFNGFVNIELVPYGNAKVVVSMGYKMDIETDRGTAAGGPKC